MARPALTRFLRTTHAGIFVGGDSRTAPSKPCLHRAVPSTSCFVIDGAAKAAGAMRPGRFDVRDEERDGARCFAHPDAAYRDGRHRLA